MSPFYKNSITEKDLVALCIKGDKKAHRMLFDLFAGRLMSVCRRYSRSQEEAEDMLQEAFIKIFSKLESYQGSGSLYGWLKSVTVNTSIKVLQKKYNKIVSEDIMDIQVHGNMPSIHHNLLAEDLMTIINALPLGYRSVFNLYELEGYSHKEIGELLEITESTSRSQLAKAKKLLKKSIPEYQKYAI